MDQNKTPNFAENLMPYNIMKFILELISHYIKYYLCPWSFETDLISVLRQMSYLFIDSVWEIYA